MRRCPLFDSLEHPGIAIPRRGRTKVRVHDLDEHFSLHLGSFEVSVEVDVLLGENNISMQFARKTRHSLKVVDILPKELVLILCLEHNNVPLRRQDSRNYLLPAVMCWREYLPQHFLFV